MWFFFNSPLLGFSEQKKTDSGRNTNEGSISWNINNFWAISGVWKNNEEKII